MTFCILIYEILLQNDLKYIVFQQIIVISITSLASGFVFKNYIKCNKVKKLNKNFYTFGRL